MKSAPIQIRNDAVVRDIRELSALIGEPITETVARAVGEKLERERRSKALARERQNREIDALIKRVKQLPIVGPELTDDDLYDEDGMPR
jgi:hypothetical protein